MEFGTMPAASFHSAALALALSVLLAALQPGAASPYGPEYDAAFEAMLEDPTDLDATFAFAVVARRSGDLEGAIGALERMLIFNPDLPVVHFELARLYARLDSREAARRYFQSALGYRPPPEIRAEIEAELARLDMAARPAAISGSAFLGFRYQSNANAAPNDSRVRVGGVDARLADEFREETDSSVVAAARLAHRHDLDRDPEIFIVSEASSYATRHAELDENEIELISATVGPEFVRPEGISWRPFLNADLVRLGNSVFYRSIGGGITGRGQLSGSPELLYSFDAAATRRNFEKSERSPALDRRDGENYRVGATLQAAPWPRSQLGGSVGWERQTSRAEDESWSGASVGVRLQRPLPGTPGSREWSLFATGRVATRRYDAPDPTIDPERNRRDSSLALSLGLAIPLAESAAVIVEGSRQRRSSNLPNFDYTDITVSAGVRFAF